MKNARDTQLQRLLIEILERDDGRFGIPLVAARRQLIAKVRDRKIECDQKMVDATIQHALDDWTVDKALAPLPIQFEEKLDLEAPGPFWYLKILTPEEQERYRSLAPVEKALIRLLRKQDEPGRRGTIPVEEAEKQLAEQGFTDIPEFMWVNEIVHDFFAFRDGKDTRCYGIVEEFRKTEEFKEHQQRMLDKSLEKQRRYIQLMEDLEEESRQRREREEKEAKQQEIKEKKLKKQKKRNPKTTEPKPCNQDWLRTCLIQTVEDVGEGYSAPLVVVEQELIKTTQDERIRCSLSDIHQAIESALDEWILDKTVMVPSEYMLDSLGYCASEVVWGLKILSEEEAERYCNLKPIVKELIKMLRERNHPRTLGMMPVSEAHRLLSERGFDDIPELIREEGIIRENYVAFDGEEVPAYEIVEHYC